MKRFEILIFAGLLLFSCKKEETPPAYEVHKNGYIRGKISGYTKDSLQIDESFSWNYMNNYTFLGNSYDSRYYIYENGYNFSFNRYSDMSERYISFMFSIDSLNKIHDLRIQFKFIKYIKDGKVLNYYLYSSDSHSYAEISGFYFNRENNSVKGNYWMINTNNKDTTIVAGDFDVNVWKY